jgi:hypothetical protein
LNLIELILKILDKKMYELELSRKDVFNIWFSIIKQISNRLEDDVFNEVNAKIDSKIEDLKKINNHHDVHEILMELLRSNTLKYHIYEDIHDIYYDIYSSMICKYVLKMSYISLENILTEKIECFNDDKDILIRTDLPWQTYHSIYIQLFNKYL